MGTPRPTQLILTTNLTFSKYRCKLTERSYLLVFQVKIELPEACYRYKALGYYKETTRSSPIRRVR